MLSILCVRIKYIIWQQGVLKWATGWFNINLLLINNYIKK